MSLYCRRLGQVVNKQVFRYEVLKGNKRGDVTECDRGCGFLGQDGQGRDLTGGELKGGKGPPLEERQGGRVLQGGQRPQP